MVEIVKQVICVSAVTFFTVLAASIVLVGIAIVLHDRHIK